MLHSRILAIAGLVSLLLRLASPGGSRADSITLAPSADTTLFQTSPGNNLGGELTVISGTTANEQANRGLFKFDIAGHVPANATIQSVSLTFTVTKTVAVESDDFTLHRVLASWGEGTGVGANKGAPASPGDATWLARAYPNALWSVPGAAAPTDFVAVASATQSILGAGSYTFGSSAQMVADAQSWLANPGTNFGWLLLCENELTPQSARRFGSREDSANAPALQIYYSVPQPPSVTLVPVADTSLFAFNPDGNLGGTTLVAGSIGLAGGGQPSRALIRFDLHNLPANAVITSVTLNLNVVRESGSGASSMFDLHRLLQPWGEGHGLSSNGQSPAAPGDANWNARSFPAPLWSVPGGAAPADFSASISSSNVISDSVSYAFSNLVADVQLWAAHSDQNFGWILMSESESVPYTARRFGSREDPVNTPTLQVQYIPQPNIAGVQINGNEIALTFFVPAGISASLQSLDSLSNTNWTTVTNYLASLNDRTNVVSPPLTGSQRFFRLEVQ